MDWEHKHPKGGVLHAASFDDAGNIHVADVWDSAEDFLASLESPDGKAAWAEIAADEPNFVNYKTTYNFIGEEALISQTPDWRGPS